MSDAIKEFLEKGGTINRLAPKYKGFKKPEKEAVVRIVFCQKCNNNEASKRFSDDEGNKYNWCEECYEQ